MRKPRFNKRIGVEFALYDKKLTPFQKLMFCYLAEKHNAKFRRYKTNLYPDLRIKLQSAADCLGLTLKEANDAYFDLDEKGYIRFIESDEKANQYLICHIFSTSEEKGESE